MFKALHHPQTAQSVRLFWNFQPARAQSILVWCQVQLRLKYEQARAINKLIASDIALT